MYTREEQKTDKEEIRTLKKLSRCEKNARVKLRYDVIILWLRGYKRKEIADIFNITYFTVRNYTINYETNGIAGLVMGKSSGAKPKMTKNQEEKLYNCITTKLPNEVGFDPFANWTAPLACKWVEKEFGIIYTERGMRDVFYRLNLSYTRPTYTLKKADPKKQDEFKKDFEVVKKTDF